MKKLVLSTGNPDKLKEIKEILEEVNIKILTKNEIGLDDFDVEEDKDTLEGNAIKKAKELKKLVDGIVMADDTGLFVEYLDGAPGVYSARYAGENCSYEDNNEKLLRELEGVELKDRSAYFETVIALVVEDGSVRTVKGRCEGKIGFERAGENGFGYDPLFIVDGYDKTFAELGDEIKNKISHRSKALEAMKDELVEILKD